jgi:uncharacterized protein (DUF58 family)
MSRELVIDACLAIGLAAVLLALTGLGVVALIAVFVIGVCAISFVVGAAGRRVRRSRGGRRRR